MFMQLFEKVQPNTLILTANNRLSHIIAHSYARNQLTQEKKAWPSLQILPWRTFLENCWQAYHHKQESIALTLLNENQEAFLWQEIIRQDSRCLLLNALDTASLVQKTWTLLHSYKISPLDKRLLSTVDGQKLSEWVLQFIQQCKKHHWITQAELDYRIQKLFEKNLLPIPTQIILVGFLEYLPSQLDLLNTIRQNKGNIIFYEEKINSVTPQTIPLHDIEAEIYTMARWAKHVHEKNQQAFIGCVVPKLNQYRPQIIRIFHEIFSKTDTSLVNITSGEPLLQKPMIYVAIEWINFCFSSISLQDVSYLLRSPFLCHSSEEYFYRSAFEAKLYSLGNKEYNFLSLYHLIPSTCSFLKKSVAEILKFLQKIPSQQSPSQWSFTFQTLLQLIDWPGTKSLNHQAHQIQPHFIKLLGELAQLDFIATTFTAHQAIQSLTQFAKNTVFQVKTSLAPIQVLGMLEAIDIPFTHIWLMGLTHRDWPGSHIPNPLLPIFLQRELNMPHGSAQRELDFCQKLMVHFSQHCHEFTISYATTQKDEILQPSGLIRHFPQITVDDLHLPPFQTLAEKSFGTEVLEMVDDENAPPVSSNEKIRGGTGILKSQAACPFQAFAQYRLHSDNLEEPETGLTALDRGLLLHKALEFIWRKIQTHTTLISLSENALKQLIEQQVEIASHELLKNKTLPHTFIQLEKDRLNQLLFNWLLLEKERQPFKTVAFEQWQIAKIGPLDFRMQVDRIDQLDSGHYVIIDYKTGKTHLRTLFGERLEEPQLPLYTLTSKYQISGLSFAQIRVDEMRFKGIAVDNNLLPQIKKLGELKIGNIQTSWETQLQQWEKDLFQLANDFYQGKAKVDPKDWPMTCRYCHLQTLCRIHEKQSK